MGRDGNRTQNGIRHAGGMMFTKKELMRAYGYALGADDLVSVMCGYLVGLLPAGVPVWEAPIRKEIEKFLK